MNIIPKYSAFQSYRLQPNVVKDRSRDDLATNAAASNKQLSLSGTTAAFSLESLKLAEEAISVGKPESIRNFLSNFDFRNISPKDLSYVGSTLFGAGVIKEDAIPLIGTEITYEIPLDPNKPMDAFKIFDDRLAANIKAGPNAGRESQIRAVDFIQRLANFAASDRDRI